MKATMTEEELRPHAEALAEDVGDLLKAVVVKAYIGILSGVVENIAPRNARIAQLEESLRELIELAEIGDADQDEANWHPALETARALLTPNA